MEIGIAFDLKADVQARVGSGGGTNQPDDRFEEYDSEETIAAIQSALESHGHRVRRLGGGRAYLEAMLNRPPELVFNIAEGFGPRSREAHVPAVAEMLQVPFTHSDPLTLALALDKAMAKRVAAAAGVPTPRFVVVERPGDLGTALENAPLSFPVIAKPLFEGSSMGIRSGSRSGDPRALQAQVERLLEGYAQPVLIEEFCPGPEMTVGILGTGAGAEVIAAMEIVPRRARPEEFIYSLEAKREWRTEVEYQVPPRRSPELIRAVEEVALRAYRALDCRDVARVDIRVGADGEPKMLELNPLPGLNPITGDLPILSERSGLDYRALIGRIVDGARARLAI